jgi:hypothetical protein
MKIAAQIIVFLCITVTPLAMIPAAGTGWFFAIWFGSSVVGGFAAMLAEA